MSQPDPLSLAGKTAWVTGAAGGIGRACVKLLAGHGARVVGLDLFMPDNPPCAEFHALDVSDPKAVGALCADLAGAGQAPDLLVNNAGITRDGVLWKLTDEDWSAVLRVNLDGAFYMTRAAVPLMRQRGGGVVVNVASINGERGKFGQSNYSASKAGLIGFTKAAARELGRFGVRVNAVAPGMIESGMTGNLDVSTLESAKNESLLGRIGQPEDVAGCVLFLCSALARHVTGHVLRVDGGQYL